MLTRFLAMARSTTVGATVSLMGTGSLAVGLAFGAAAAAADKKSNNRAFICQAINVQVRL